MALGRSGRGSRAAPLVAGILTITLGRSAAVAQVFGHRDRARGARGDRRRDLDADEAVLALRLVVDGPEDVGRGLDVLDHQLPQDLRRASPWP